MNEVQYDVLALVHGETLAGTEGEEAFIPAVTQGHPGAANPSVEADPETDTTVTIVVRVLT